MIYLELPDWYNKECFDPIMAWVLAKGGLYAKILTINTYSYWMEARDPSMPAMMALYGLLAPRPKRPEDSPPPPGMDWYRLSAAGAFFVSCFPEHFEPLRQQQAIADKEAELESMKSASRGEKIMFRDGKQIVVDRDGNELPSNPDDQENE